MRHRVLLTGNKAKRFVERRRGWQADHSFVWQLAGETFHNFTVPKTDIEFFI